MRIIISPAKKMRADTDSLSYQSLPQFLEQSETLFRLLKGKEYQQLKALWNCNDAIASLNFQQLQVMDLYRNLTPAILAHEGIPYQHMAPGVFDDDQIGYIGTHLRILSGFYGLLRPFDGVTSYRLEMQAKLTATGFKDLYGFWGEKLAEQLCQ